MKVDAHHHLWDPQSRDYPWMTGEAAALARRFDIADLRRELAATPVDITVVVQAAAAEDETNDLLTIASGSEGLIAGVVGWVDLTAVDVADRLASLMATTAGQLLVGVRHQTHDEADPAWLSRDDVRRGLRAVSELGLVFDLLVRARELPAAIAAATALPDLRFVLDHMAKPPIAAGEPEPWASLVAELARRDNVTCKLSGLLTEAAPPAAATMLAPYVDHVLRAFGATRLMFGSDWPVSTLRAGYLDVYEMATNLTSTLSPPEQDAVFGENAVKIYGLL